MEDRGSMPLCWWSIEENRSRRFTEGARWQAVRIVFRRERRELEFELAFKGEEKGGWIFGALKVLLGCDVEGMKCCELPEKEDV